MSARQLEFAKHYVLNGGNATKAAAMAGYSESDLAKAGLRASLHPRVQAEVRRLAIANGSMLLPILIRKAFEVAMDPETPARDALTAVFGLADRLGMAVPKAGIAVNFNNNVTNVDARSIINQVWDARERRLSGIDDTMHGNIPPPLQDHASAIVEQPASLGWGGVAAERGSVPDLDIPPHPPEAHPLIKPDLDYD